MTALMLVGIVIRPPAFVTAVRGRQRLLSLTARGDGHGCSQSQSEAELVRHHWPPFTGARVQASSQ